MNLLSCPLSLRKAIGYIAQNITEVIELDQLANESGYSKSALCRQFASYLKMSPLKWVWFLRVNLAHDVMQSNPQLSLTQVAAMCGFQSSSHFSRSYKHFMGVPPRLSSQLASKKLEATPMVDLLAETIMHTKLGFMEGLSA